MVDRKRFRIFTLLIAFCAVTIAGSVMAANVPGFKLYHGKRINITKRIELRGLSLKQCSFTCNKVTSFSCKSFEYVNSQKRCLLTDKKPGDRGVKVLSASNVDYYVRGGAAASPPPKKVPTQTYRVPAPTAIELAKRKGYQFTLTQVYSGVPRREWFPPLPWNGENNVSKGKCQGERMQVNRPAGVINLMFLRSENHCRRSSNGVFRFFMFVRNGRGLREYLVRGKNSKYRARLKPGWSVEEIKLGGGLYVWRYKPPKGSPYLTFVIDLEAPPGKIRSISLTEIILRGPKGRNYREAF